MELEGFNWRRNSPWRAILSSSCGCSPPVSSHQRDTRSSAVEELSRLVFSLLFALAAIGMSVVLMSPGRAASQPGCSQRCLSTAL
jgi:hypothetical protein